MTRNTAFSLWTVFFQVKRCHDKIIVQCTMGAEDWLHVYTLATETDHYTVADSINYKMSVKYVSVIAIRHRLHTTMCCCGTLSM